MSEATKELITEARRSSDALRNAPFKINRDSMADGIDKLADALAAERGHMQPLARWVGLPEDAPSLEIACEVSAALEARQPTEDDELARVEAELAEWLAGKRSWCDQHHGKPDEIELTAKADEATIRLLIVKRDALRAAVPDAATEELRADVMTADEAIESVIKRPGMFGLVDKEGHRRMKAERDAALAAVERVRAICDEYERVGKTNTKIPFEASHLWPKEPNLGDVIAALNGAPEPETIQTLFYAPNLRNGTHTGKPDGITDNRHWHQDATADTGASHNLPGRLYVVQCEWCPKAFAANTKGEAMTMFRAHEAEMSEALPIEKEQSND